MPFYTYHVIDEQGRSIERTTEAASEYALTIDLESRGYIIESIQANGAPSPPPIPQTNRQLRWEDLRLFSEQLSAITRSGYPLAPALKAMATDLHRPQLRHAMEDLCRSLERGETLEDAMHRQEGRFPPLYAALMRAGELTGDLSRVLDMMSHHATRMAKVKHRIKMALAYPVILLVCSINVILYQLFEIVPIFGEIFSEMGAKLPAPTLLLLYASRILTSYWPNLLTAFPLILVVLGGAYYLLMRTSPGRRFFENLLIYFPGIGMAYVGIVQARYCRTLCLLLEARVPMLDAMTLAGAASGCTVLEHGLIGARREVSGGSRLADSLRNTHFFSPSFYWLLGTAEERGQVVDALDLLAESAERRVDTREQLLGSFITPVLTVLIGIVIGFIAIALYLPTFTLGDQIGVG